MTALLRCRGTLGKIAALFAAEAPARLDWTPEIWPGEPVLTVFAGEDRRHIAAMRWGLPADAFAGRRSRARRGSLFARDLVRGAGTLADPAALRRCLIVLEAFAYPDGPPGRRTRAWAGVWDRPLAAWAGVWTGSGAEAGCAGVLTLSNERIAAVSQHMPVLLAPGDHDSWLNGPGWLLAATPIAEAAAFYLERTDERWSTGAPFDEGG